MAGLTALSVAYITTAGEPAISKTTGYVSYAKNEFWIWIRLYHLFGFLWLANFIIACQHMVIAGAVAGWYFTRDKSQLSLPIASSFWRLCRYHLGSVAFGSFIIALVQLIRFIMKYVEKKLSKKPGAGAVIGPLLKGLTYISPLDNSHPGQFCPFSPKFVNQMIRITSIHFV